MFKNLISFLTILSLSFILTGCNGSSSSSPKDTTAPVVIATVDETTGQISLTADELASIYYTLDGSEPSIESIMYTMPFSLSKATTVKYYAQDTAGNKSEIVSKTYIFSIVLDQNYTSTNKIKDTRAIFLDRDGNLWFASYGKGVSKYDTNTDTWQTYTTDDGLVNNWVTTVAQDDDGNMYFGGNGVSKYDTNGEWTNINEGLKFADIKSLTTDSQGNIWVIGTEGNIGKYDGLSWYNYGYDDVGFSGSYISVFAEDTQGNLWVGTRANKLYETEGEGVRKYNGTDWETYTKENGLTGNSITAIVQDKNGNMWIGTTNNGLNQYTLGEDNKIWKNYLSEEINGLLSDKITNLFVDSKNNLWVMTDESGISRLDINRGTWTTPYTTLNGLSDNNTYAVAEDADGNLWFGNSSAFVDKFDGENWSMQRLAPDNELQSNAIRSGFKDSDDNLWFGTYGGGVSRYDGNTWITYSTKDGLVGNIVNSILKDVDGNLWFATHSGVSKYDGSNWTLYNTKNTDNGLASNTIKTIAQDKLGNLWFGTDGGVSRYNVSENKWTTYTTENTNSLKHNTINSIATDAQDNLWFGTGGGVSKYDINSNTWRDTYTTDDGLINNRVNSIVKDSQDNLWFATGKGVSKYDGDWTTYTTESTNGGLVSNYNYINTIFEDNNGNLWFGANGGASKYDGINWTPYTKEDNGLVGNSVNVILEDNKNNLWFGADGGISKFRYLLQEN